MSLPFEITEDTPVYVISVAAELTGLHPQTLRQYDRLGLVSPDRSTGRNRRYSLRDIEALREVSRLSAEGINLTGVKRIIELELQVAALQARVRELEGDLAQARREAAGRHVRRDLVPYTGYASGAALTVWRPRPRG